VRDRGLRVAGDESGRLGRRLRAGPAVDGGRALVAACRSRAVTHTSDYFELCQSFSSITATTTNIVPTFVSYDPLEEENVYLLESRSDAQETYWPESRPFSDPGDRRADSLIGELMALAGRKCLCSSRKVSYHFEQYRLILFRKADSLFS